jgi:hypothetical protein
MSDALKLPALPFGGSDVERATSLLSYVEVALVLGAEADGAHSRGFTSLGRHLATQASTIYLHLAEAWPSTDPMRARLYNLAAQNALSASRPDDAARLVHQGMICLHGLLPPEIAEELFRTLARATT